MNSTRTGQPAQPKSEHVPAPFTVCRETPKRLPGAKNRPQVLLVDRPRGFWAKAITWIVATHYRLQEGRDGRRGQW